MTNSDYKYMIEGMSADLAELLSREYDMNIIEALDVLYNSETYAKLTDTRTGLYFQSPGYVYSFLKSEMATGKLA